MSNSEKKFPCTMCGACCARIGEVVRTAEIDGVDLGYAFPVNDDGSCGHRIPIMTAEGNVRPGCEIYETRPIVCNIELGAPQDMTRREWFRLNAMSCNYMQEEQNIDNAYRVKVDKD